MTYRIMATKRHHIVLWLAIHCHWLIQRPYMCRLSVIERRNCWRREQDAWLRYFMLPQLPLTRGCSVFLGVRVYKNIHSPSYKVEKDLGVLCWVILF